jgi:hypothetical protein
MRAWHASVLFTFLIACGRTVAPEAAPSSSGGSSSAGIAGSSSTGGSTGAVAALGCEQPHPGPKPLSRLRADELTESVRRLLPGYDVKLELPQYGEVDLSQAYVELDALHRLAHDAALSVAGDPTLLVAVTDCDPESADCRDHFIQRFVTRAFRHPATPSERSELSAVFETGRELQGEFAGGVQAVIEVVLQSPEFLYLVELGTGEELGGAVRLSAPETAARLAYFLTGAPPDDELSAAAEQGALDEDGIAAQTRRLIGSAANRLRVQALYRRLYGFGSQQGAPQATDLARLALLETTTFIDNVTFAGPGTFRALLTQPTSWLNEPLALSYGYEGVVGEDLREVALDPTQRGGLFTQAALLGLDFSASSTRPVQRGMRVLSSLLCQDILPPPPDVPFTEPELEPGTATMRQRLTRMTAGSDCQRCHRDINPVGFAFEHYDPVGRFRELDEGLPVDSSGELFVTDARGPFENAIELLQRIAESDDAQACFVHHWLEHAYRRAEEPADACARAELQQAFSGADGNVIELMGALARSDNFRFRQKSELAPED